MRTPILTGIFLFALAIAGAAPALAAVNCGIINKDLNLGRKPEDIAERMGVSVKDVQVCKEQGGAGTTGTPPAASTPSTPSKGAATPPTPPADRKME